MLKTNQQPLMQRLLPFIIITLAASFYVYEFILRVMPSAMTTELMADFDIDASGLGALSAMFFYGYAPMQIPAGLMLDRFGPRMLISCSVLLCGLGALLFGATDSIYFAGLGRFFIGATSAFAFIGALVLASRWFAAKYFATITGLIQFMGSMGAIAGAAPVTVLVEHYGWRPTQMWSGAIGIILATLLWLIVRDAPDQKINVAKHPMPKKLTECERINQVLGHRQTWVNGLISFCAWGPMSIFTVLWGVPFLERLYQIDSTDAAQMIAFAWIGTALGAPLMGWWSNRINSRRTPLITGAVIGLISSLVVIYLPQPPVALMLLMLFFMGIAASAMTVNFGVVQDIHPPTVAGTAVGYTNMMVIGAGVLLQPLVGVVLDHLWRGSLQHGVPVYDLAHYRIALSGIPICNLIGLIACYFLRETHCAAQYELKIPR